jgi:hypothetical protein
MIPLSDLAEIVWGSAYVIRDNGISPRERFRNFQRYTIPACENKFHR